MARFDPVLEPYLRASGDESDRCLAELLGGATERAIRGIIGRTLGSRRGSASSGGYRTCYSCLRRLYPGRARLMSRVRYALASDRRFTMDQDAAGVWRCGLAMQTVPAVPATGAAQFARDPIAFVRDALGPSPDGRDAARLVEPVLQRTGEPIDLDALVDAVAAVLGIDERAHLRTSIDDPHRPVDVADGAASVSQTLMDRQYLARLWDEVRGLPVRQRAAILRNLRDEDGRSALPLLPLTGIATIREMAAALEMPAADLATLWRDLPLEAARIAERLGLTRQQVINLRKSARLRLGRRMTAFGNTERK